MTEAKKDEKPWTVTTRDTGSGSRTVFRGTEDDAYAFVEANFPRVHVEPGTDYGDDGPEPDVYVNSGDGKKAYGFNGDEWVEYTE